MADIRDRVEIVYTPDFGNFLQRLFPLFKSLLTATPMQSTAGPLNSLRHNLLEVLAQLPNVEALTPYVADMYVCVCLFRSVFVSLSRA